jgi:hypothetical protein
MTGGTETRIEPTTDDLADLESLGDGRHHLWCKTCHPEWVARPLGAELGVPFTAVCGERVVIIAIWQSDDLPPGVCEACAAPGTPCAVCGAL